MDVVAPNEWTQVGSPEWTQIDDGMLNTQMSSGGGILAAASPAMAAMAAAGGAAAGGSTAAGGQQQQQQQALRCPRCDSSNTKFCYYNNYSLSQPRHFCKACKRYWTRGGTLRNVPVGGGCRKNKRVKKPNTTSTNSSSSASSPSAADPSPSPLPSLPFLPNPTAISSASPSPDLGFLLYSLANSGSDGTQLGFPGLRQESMPLPCAPYGALPTQLGLLGLGYQSINPDELDYLPSLKAHTQVTQTVPTSTAPPLLQEYPVFGSHAASLLASTLRQHQQQHHHHKLVQNPDLSPYASGSFQLFRDVKLDGGGDASGVMGGGARNTSDWQLPPCENAIVDDAEPSLYWNGVWPDHAATCGPYSSLAPLI